MQGGCKKGHEALKIAKAMARSRENPHPATSQTSKMGPPAPRTARRQQAESALRALRRLVAKNALHEERVK